MNEMAEVPAVEETEFVWVCANCESEETVNMVWDSGREMSVEVCAECGGDEFMEIEFN